MEADKKQRVAITVFRHAFTYIALWQCAAFLILLLLVWVNELLDFAHLLFNEPKQDPDPIRACLATAGVLLGLIVTVGNTYLQHRSIVGGVLTICSYCRRVRMEPQVWQQIEQYFHRHSSVRLSHGICPTCYEKAMAELDAKEAEAARARG